MNTKPENLNSFSPDAGDLEALVRKGLAQRLEPASAAEVQRTVRTLARLRPAALHALHAMRALSVAATQPPRLDETAALDFHHTLKTLAS